MPDTKLTPDASTYKQVVKNMTDIDALKTSMKDVQDDIKDVQDELGGTGEPGSSSIRDQIKEVTSNMETITKEIEKITEALDSNVTGDVVGKFPDLKVVGIHANTDKVADNTPPSGYTRDITYEIKSVESIGLSGKKGVTGKYCLMITASVASQKDDESAIDFNPFRIAFGNSLKRFYSEAKSDDDSWTEWLEEEEPRCDVNIVASDSEPGKDQQIEGDLWFENLK